MAIAAANLVDVRAGRDPRRAVEFLALSGRVARGAVRTCGATREPAAQALGALPMEVLQAAFWSLDPERTVSKFAEFGRLDPTSAEARRFVELEDWANEGEPLPYPAAQRADRGPVRRAIFRDAGNGGSAASAITRPLARAARSTSSRRATASRPPRPRRPGDAVAIASGHVGMIVGSARDRASRRAQQPSSTPACR